MSSQELSDPLSLSHSTLLLIIPLLLLPDAHVGLQLDENIRHGLVFIRKAPALFCTLYHLREGRDTQREREREREKRYDL